MSIDNKIFKKVRPISKTAEHILKKRYYWEGENKWEDVADRVVDNVIGNWKDKDKEIMRSMIRNTYFVPNSPCLVNAGRREGGLAACFVLDFPDDTVEIYKTKLDFALIARKGGGCGTTLSKIRPEGDFVDGSTHGYAGGPIKFADTISHDMDAMTQAGFRSMAIMLTMSIYHPDILRFINAKEEEGRIANANISVVVDNEFMNKVQNGEKYWTEFNSKKYHEYDARTVFDMIVEGMWRNGEPGLLFKDQIDDSPYKYTGQEILATNPCLSKDTWLLGNNVLEKISDTNNYKTWKTGYKQCIKLTTNAGYEIVVTPDHKIMLNDGSFIEAKKSLGKQLKWNVGTRKIESVDQNYFLMGFLFGDGYICGNGKGISVKIDPDKESDMCKLLESFGFCRQDNGAYYINRGTIEEKLNAPLTFLENRVYDRELPDEILSLNSDRLGSFLRGLFEANGSVTKSTSQISLKATNRETIRKTQIALSSFGIKSWVVKNKPTKIEWDNGTYISRTSYNLQIAPRNSQIFKKNIGFYSDYKNNRIKQLDRKYNGKLIVKEVTDVGKKEVWDFTSPTSCAVSNGIIAHNCAEQPLPPNGLCNLGSIDLSKFVDEDKKIEWGKLEIASRLGVRFLDSVIDQTGFPTKDIEKWAIENRAIGLGIMGFADLCLMKEIAYGDENSLTLLEKILSFIEEKAINESEILGQEKGIPIQCKKLPVPRRNITVNTIAPTGTVSLIAGCSSGIEPIFSEIVIRNDKTGTYTFKNDLASQPYFRCAVSSTGEKEVTWEEHINILASAQKHIQSGVSKTINFPQGTHRETIGKASILAWELGCKGVAMYRNKSRKTQVLTPKNIKKEKCPVCGGEVVRIDGKLKCTSCTEEIIENTTTYYD